MGLIIVLVLVGLGISYVYQKSLWKSHPKNDIIIENIFVWDSRILNCHCFAH